MFFTTKTKCKPHISKTKWDGTQDGMWWTEYDGKWYVGISIKDSYNNFMKYNYYEND